MKLRQCIISFILGALIFSSAIVYATNGSMIEVFYNINDLVINGVSKMPESKPFIYNGSTYVPLRYVSETLGYDVEWDGNTQTVYIGQVNKEGIVYPGNGIESMNTQGRISYAYMGENILDNVNNKHNSYIVSSIPFGRTEQELMYIEFPTNSQYSKFTGKIALTEKYKSTKAQMMINIYADDKLIFTQEMTAGSMPKDINIDITNAIKVKLEVTHSRGYSEVAIFEPTFK